MWRAFDSKKSCSVLLGGKQPVLDFRLPLGITHPNTGLLLLKKKKKQLHSEKSLYSSSVGHPSSSMVLSLPCSLSSKQASTLGTWHWLLPLPGMLTPRYLHGQLIHQG